MDLADFRNQIDEIDQELMALFRRRMETVEQIAAYKEQHGLPVYDPQREEEKRTALLAQLPPALRDDAGALHFQAPGEHIHVPPGAGHPGNSRTSRPLHRSPGSALCGGSCGRSHL